VYLWKKNWIGLSNVVQEENLPLCPNGINFVDKDNGWGKLISNTKELSHQLGTIPQILLYQFTSNHPQKCCQCGIRHCLLQIPTPGLYFYIAPHALVPITTQNNKIPQS
jgi:hypothetical protein